MTRLLSALLLLAGCAPGVERIDPSQGGATDGPDPAQGYPESPGMRLASVVDAQADGFAMGEGRATVAMREMTCGVHVDSGSVFFDVDLRDGRIQDGTDDPEVTLTSLVVAPPLVHLLPVENPYDGDNYLVRGVREARLLGDRGFVALRRDAETGDCAVRWYEGGHLTAEVPLEGISCDGTLDLALDVDARRAYVAAPDGVFVVDTEGAEDLGLAGDALAWDATEALLYVGEVGGTTLTAVAADGPVWTATLEGPLVDLDDAGRPGGVAVVHEAGLGADVVLLHADGTERDRLLFDAPVYDIAVSDGGGLLAVARHADHGYYRID